MEATYHVLLTSKSLMDSPASNHWFLPTVSLSRDLDKNILWGNTVSTSSGDEIYTSFNSPGFIAPYLWFKATNLEISPQNLYIFNVLLSLISIVTLYALIFGILNTQTQKHWTSMGAAVIGCSIGIFSREPLLSQGLVYWCQNLYQVILTASVYVLFVIKTSPPEKSTPKENFLITLCFIGAFTEWSGYIFNIGLMVLFWLEKQAPARSKKIAFKIFLATGAAGLLTILHLSLAVGFLDAFEALAKSFLYRSASAGSLIDLAKGYELSYGYFLLIVLASVISIAYWKTQKSYSPQQNLITFLIVASSIPLIENIIMLQHATQFSFDRLKFIIPAAIAIAYCFANYNLFIKAILLAAAVYSSANGYATYRSDQSTYLIWKDVDISNRAFAKAVMSKVDKDCTLFTSSFGVRGYANFIFESGIYEYATLAEAEKLVKKRNGCALVYLEGNYIYADIPHYTKATIIKNGEPAIQLEVGKL